MIRLSEAHARMRYSETVDLEDVKEAVRLIKSALRESAVSHQLSLTSGSGTDFRLRPIP